MFIIASYPLSMRRAVLNGTEPSSLSFSHELFHLAFLPLLSWRNLNQLRLTLPSLVCSPQICPAQVRLTQIRPTQIGMA